MAMNPELLTVRVVRRGVAVVEDDLEVPVWQRDGVRTLIEVTVVLVERWVEEVAEEAERAGVPADFLRGREADSAVGRHRTEDRRLAITQRRVGVRLRAAARPELQAGPRPVALPAVRPPLLPTS